MKIIKFSAVVIYCVLSISVLTACSSDSGTTPDATVLTVKSTNPAASAAGVEIDQAISITFSEAVNSASVTNSSLFVTGPSGNVAGNVTVRGDTAMFKASSPFTHNSNYTVTVANPLAEAYNWSYTTRAPWTYQLGTIDDDQGIGVATDADDNVYVVGITDGDLDGNTSAGLRDLFVTKYNASGTKQWTRQFGSSFHDSSVHVATDASGNVCLAGTIEGDLDGNTSAGRTDLFVTQYNSSGTKQWTRQLGSAEYELGLGVATDTSGNVYAIGITYGGLDGNASAGNTDLFVTKYSASGMKQWTRQLGAAGYEEGRGVATDASGNVYVTGTTDGDLDGNTSAGGNDLFVTKYNTSGTKQWTRQWGTTGDDQSRGVATDASGNVYVTGTTDGNLDGNTSAGGNDLFVIQYNSSGTKQWARQWGTASNDQSRGVATDASGNIYVSGDTDGDLDGNISAGWNDMFVTQYSASGAKQWTRQLGSTATDFGHGVATDTSGDVYVTGYTRGDLDGNANAGGNDIFVTKYNSVGYKK